MASVHEVNINRLNGKLQTNSSSISPASHRDIEPTHRLIVLVPDADIDYVAATRRVWQLASDAGADIRFIGLCKNVLQESSIRRQLILMTAMVQESNVSAEAKVEFGNSWVNIVKSNWQAGDVVVCFAEQQTGLFYSPLSQILQSDLDIPLSILSDQHYKNPSIINGLSRIALWVGFIAIVVGSVLLQIRITALVEDWAQTVLLILSVLTEFWLILAWNNLFN
jgi:hypothetical protein